MKGYTFIKYVLPFFICGKNVALYVSKTDDTKFIAAHESSDGDVIEMREIDGSSDLYYFTTMVETTYGRLTCGAAYEFAVNYVRGRG